MSEIKPIERFTFSLEHEIAYQDANGVWVKFAAYEALQKENERLDFKFKHYCGRIRKVLQRHRERDAAQAKRIAELYDVSNDHRNAYIAASKALDSQKSEIESLSKKIEDYEFLFEILKQIDGIKKVIGS